MNENLLVKHFKFVLINFIIFFTPYIYGQEPGVSQQNKLKKDSCMNAVLKKERTQSWVGNIVKSQYANLVYAFRVTKQLFGSLLEEIPYSSASELAEDIYRNKYKYGLVFYGLRGTFTDRGIFDFLETHPHVIRVQANETKMFYIHASPSLFNSFTIYLVHKTSHGEILSYVDGQTKTGVLIHWFRQNINNLDWSSHIPIDMLQKPVTLRGIFRQLHAAYLLNLKFNESSSPEYRNSSIDLNVIFEIQKDIPDDIESVVKLASAYNRIRTIRPISMTQFIHTVKHLSELVEDPKTQTKIASSSRHNILFLTMLTGFTLQEMLDLSGDFPLFDGSRYGRFLSKVLFVQIVLNEIESLKPPHRRISSESLSIQQVRAFLSQAAMAYEHEQEAQNFGSMIDFQNAYLAVLLGDGDTTPESIFDNTFYDIQSIKEFFNNDSMYHLLHLANGAMGHPAREALGKIYSNRYVGTILLISAAFHIPVERLIRAFDVIVENVKHPEVTLILLRGISVGYLSNDMIRLDRLTFTFFQHEEVNSIHGINLLVSGLTADLRPEQSVSLLREVSFQLESHHVSPGFIINFVDSIMNLRAMPYQRALLNGVTQAVRYDADGRVQPVSTSEVYNYLMSQMIYLMQISTHY